MATTMTTPITIPYPSIEGDLDLRIEAGACRLWLSPAEGEAWITGTYNDPSGSITVTTAVEGSRASIRVGRSPADFFGFLSGVPELTLQIGPRRPFTLTIAAGASESHFELGGLPIKRLEINHGAGAVEVMFSAPLPVPTALMKFGVGAGKTKVYKLGNVNFSELSVDGGAASCMLDFSGSILTAGAVRLSTAMAAVEVRIPAGLAAEVTSDTLLGQPHADTGFSRRGGGWLSRAAADGKPIQLRIRSTMVMGQLHLVTVA